MQYRTLGRSDIRISALCMGTMTYGEQNSTAEAHQQLDYALDRGINFIDTAEMYAVPVRAETYGRSEEIVGAWQRQRQCRDKVIIASKITGPGGRFQHIRDGEPRLNRKHIEAGLENSLRRLQTDYVDLYQLHWPERNTNTFGRLGYQHKPEQDGIPLEETLQVLDDLVRAGKIRTIGISNETPWGVMRFMQLSESLGLARMVSIQNPYNLLNRTFEVGLAEVAIREDCGLLAYGVLGSGMLSGKYLQGAQPEGARLTLWPDYFPRYLSRGSRDATARYVEIAQKHGLDPSAMAIAWALKQPFMSSVILGATKMSQLQVTCDAAELQLSEQVLLDIEAVHEAQPNAYLIR